MTKTLEIKNCGECPCLGEEIIFNSQEYVCGLMTEKYNLVCNISDDVDEICPLRKCNFKLKLKKVKKGTAKYRKVYKNEISGKTYYSEWSSENAHIKKSIKILKERYPYINIKMEKKYE